MCIFTFYKVRMASALIIMKGYDNRIKKVVASVMALTMVFGGAAVPGSVFAENGVISADAAAKKAVMNPYIFVDMGEDSISLEWGKVDGAEEYAIVGMVNNRWKILDQVKDNSTKYFLNSYLLENLKSGKKYTVAVAAKLNGKWNTDLSNAVTVVPGMPASVYPWFSANPVGDGKIHFAWDHVPEAENYGIVVFLNNKWVLYKELQGGDFCFLDWTTPQLSKKTYKVAVITKVNGEWMTEKAPSHAITVTVK